MPNQQTETNRAVATALLQTVELIEETIADVENGQDPEDALATLLTMVLDQAMEAAEAAGMVTEIRVIRGGCGRMCQVIGLCKNGPISIRNS